MQSREVQIRWKGYSLARAQNNGLRFKKPPSPLFFLSSCITNDHPTYRHTLLEKRPSGLTVHQARQAITFATPNVSRRRSAAVVEARVPEEFAKLTEGCRRFWKERTFSRWWRQKTPKIILQADWKPATTLSSTSSAYPIMSSHFAWPHLQSGE